MPCFLNGALNAPFNGAFWRVSGQRNNQHSMHTFNKTGTVTKKIPANSSGIITIAENLLDGALSYSDRIVSHNLFIKNLKAYAKIRSVPVSPMPMLLDEDNESTRIKKVLDIEWRSARKQLDLFISESEEHPWHPVGSVSLLNPSAYPYRSYNLLDVFTANLAIELGSKGRIGIRAFDVGYGLLNPEDEVTIHGSFVQEITVADTAEQNGNNQIAAPSFSPVLVDNESTELLGENLDRIYCLIQNVGREGNCYIRLGNNVGIGDGMLIRPGGKFEFYTKNLPYFGKISAISDSTNSLIYVTFA